MKKILFLIFSISLLIAKCDTKLFSLSTEGENGVVLKNIITDIADTCELNILITDNIAKEKLKEEIKYIKLKNKTLKEFLDFILTKNGYFYTLDNNTLIISYIKTKNFKVDYINNTITGTTNFSASTTDSGGGSNTLNSNFSFDFWTDFSKNIDDILQATADEYYKTPKPIINKASGIITVTGTKKQLDKIQKYINEINKRLHKEILVDVRIYSVKLSKSNSTGINWSNFNLSTNANVPITGAIGQTILDSTSFSLNGLLNFLAQYGQVNSISNPKITTLNNQKAIITVGQTINYSYKKVTTDANGNAIQSDVIDSKFVGILLDIMPEISDDNIIIMNINPSISSLSPVQLNPGLPPDTIEKKLNTIVRIKDGDTIILGGLITDQKTFAQNGVPILKEIPVIKYLFSSKEEISNREELIFILTPHIIDLDKKISSDKFKLPSLGDL
jgi:general secretion pathway protein D